MTDQVIESCLIKLNPIIEVSNVTIAFDKNMPNLNCDFEYIHKTFFHILKNSILYCKEDVLNEIKITYTKEDGFWKFCISDNGIGIERKNLEKVFVAMYKDIRLDNHQGEGIGLALAKKVVNRYNGRIWIESEKDIGTKVFLTLPI